MSDILLITPPFTQLNTPYPATAYLKGFLSSLSISSTQIDLGIEVILEIFSKRGLSLLFEECDVTDLYSENAQRIYGLRRQYIDTIDPVIAFLQGGNAVLSRRICSLSYLPMASRFDHDVDLEYSFGTMGLNDKAKHLATLYLEDMSDFIKECVDEKFGFSRYAESLSRSANSFDELYAALQMPHTYIDEVMETKVKEILTQSKPKLIAISVPFPGNLYSALRLGSIIKEYYPEIEIAMGGGFPNTELRSMKDPRLFDFVDYVTLDDGELPIELLYENITSVAGQKTYKRTFLRENGKVVYIDDSDRGDYAFSELTVPDYSDLRLDKYLSVMEIANPMHALWSDGQWIKLTMAHGCYWGKCTFCDVSLDYISNYQGLTATILVDRMEALITQTGYRSFHFVDEAAPPALMKEVALEILSRDLTVVWWTNIRFEKSFTADLCRLLHASGCIAVSGGLEVASDRLLKLIDKGVSMTQVAKVTHSFSEAGIMVHAYLMYGYPTQTVQETIDSLEMVRQLFELGLVQSGFWHRFALTAHSPISEDPEAYGVIPNNPEITFAENDVEFEDLTGIDHSIFSYGLKKSLYNYMHGVGFDILVSEWFEASLPSSEVDADYIERVLHEDIFSQARTHARMVWIGAYSHWDDEDGKMHVILHGTSEDVSMLLDTSLWTWLQPWLDRMRPQRNENIALKSFEASFEEKFEAENMMDAEWFDALRYVGLLLV